MEDKMLSAEGIGKTIEKAIENALFELKAKREDVDIKILEEGGIFKKAKVLVSISEDSKEQYDKKPQKTDEPIEKLDVKAMFADLKPESKKEDKKVKPVKKEDKKTKEIVNEKTSSSKETISGKDFIKGILKQLNIEANVFVEESAENINISIEGGNAGDLIGYRGECLNAIQYIASIVENENSQSRKRLTLDIEKYRARREESLKSLAHRMERKVLKTNKSIKLEPMSANERRIIHTELQECEGITTISKGLEPNRYIIILPKRANQSTEKNDETESEE